MTSALVIRRSTPDDAPAFVRLFSDEDLFGNTLQLPYPDGHRLVTYVRDEVLEPDELLVPVVLPRFAPTWPNAFHWLTHTRSEERRVGKEC